MTLTLQLVVGIPKHFHLPCQMFTLLLHLVLLRQGHLITGDNLSEPLLSVVDQSRLHLFEGGLPEGLIYLVIFDIGDGIQLRQLFQELRRRRLWGSLLLEGVVDVVSLGHQVLLLGVIGLRVVFELFELQTQRLYVALQLFHQLSHVSQLVIPAQQFLLPQNEVGVQECEFHGQLDVLLSGGGELEVQLPVVSEEPLDLFEAQLAGLLGAQRRGALHHSNLIKSYYYHGHRGLYWSTNICYFRLNYPINDCRCPDYQSVMSSPPAQLSDAKYAALCGASSFLATLVSNVLHPLELIKTRFQSHDGSQNERNLVPKYGGIYSAIKTIAQKEGTLGLFKGFYVSFLSQSAAQALFFTIYENRLVQYERTNQDHMAAVTKASLEASILATILTQPLWIVRTRMLLTTVKVNQKENFKYNAKQLYQEYGFRGFFRGLFLSVILSMNGFIQMYVYEAFKQMIHSLDSDHYNHTIGAYLFNAKAFFSGGVAKLISGTIMHPITTIRTRYQQNQYIVETGKPKYSGMADIVTRILRDEGVLGFYKGFYVNLVKGFLQRGVYFYFYELFKTGFGVENGHHSKKKEDI